MLSNLEALDAFAETGSMGRAGLKLRVTQSAVSKRIAALEAQCGQKLVEKQGRLAVLTPAGVGLLERLRPLLAELRDAFREAEGVPASTLTIGVSESVLASWGADLLRRALSSLPHLRLCLHTHRSPVVESRVYAGEYQLGLVAGRAGSNAGLQCIEILREPMVIVPSGLEPLKRSKGSETPVVTIEARSATWEAISRRSRQHGLLATTRVESFFAAARMAVAGFGHGLVPLGVCEALRIPEGKLVALKRPEVSRPIAIVGRATTLARPAAQALVAALAAESQRLALRYKGN